MTRASLWIVLAALGFIHKPVLGQDQKAASDSTIRPHFSITPRFNSAGHFPYSGALINKNINFDINVFFEYKRYGFFVFKSYDIEDTHSIVNYLQPGIFAKIPVSSELYLRVFVGYLFSQTTGFRDADSDYYTAAVAYWTINDRLKLENTALFFDLTKSGKLANRVLLAWSLKNFKVDLYVWNRIVFESGIHATSASLALNSPSIKLSKSLSIQTTFSYLRYITDTKPSFALRDGFLFSIAFPLVLSE